MPPLLAKALYWAAVVAVSLALVVALILFLDSRDEPEIENPASRANTTIRFAAL